MEFTDAITGSNIQKRFGGFELNIPKLHIPKGFALICPLPGYLLLLAKGAFTSFPARYFSHGLLLALSIWAGGNILTLILRHLENVMVIVLVIYASTILLIPLVALQLEFITSHAVCAFIVFLELVLGSAFACLHFMAAGTAADVRWYCDNQQTGGKKK